MSVQQILLALAGNPALLPEHVDELIATGDPAVLRELATQQRLTPAQLETLAAGGDRDVVLALIRSGKLGAERIRRDDPWMLLAGVSRADACGDWVGLLASWPDPAVRHALGEQHASERLDVAEALADDELCSVAAYAAELYDLPVELAHRLAGRTEACVRVALAGSWHAPARVLAELIDDGATPPMRSCPHWPDRPAALREVRRAAAGNPATPLDTVVPFTTEPDLPMALALSRRRDLAEETYDRLVALRDPEVTARVASNWAAPPDLLRRLYDEGGRWRNSVMANPQTPLDVLVRHSRGGGSPTTDFHPDLDGLQGLAADADPRVRLVAAASYRLPADVRTLLIDDPDFEVACRAIRFPTASAEQIRTTAARYGAAMFPALAGHPSCPPEILLTIVTHPQTSAETVTEVAGNEASPPAALAACLLHPANAGYVACNPATPGDMLIELASHPDPQVIQEVARNPNLPVPACRRILHFAVAQHRRSHGHVGESAPQAP